MLVGTKYKSGPHWVSNGRYHTTPTMLNDLCGLYNLAISILKNLTYLKVCAKCESCVSLCSDLQCIIMNFFYLQLKALRQEIEVRMKKSVKHGQTVSGEVLG